MMRRTILLTALFLATTSSYNLPRAQPSRREALDRIAISTALPFLATVPSAARAADAPQAKAVDDTSKLAEIPPNETEEEKKKRIMREKIALSKTNYRKPDGKDKSPFRLLNQK